MDALSKEEKEAFFMHFLILTSLANLVICRWPHEMFSRAACFETPALDGFAAAYDYAGMKSSTAKTEILHFLRKPVQCSLQVGGMKLKQVERFKYLESAFTNDNGKISKLQYETKIVFPNELVSPKLRSKD